MHSVRMLAWLLVLPLSLAAVEPVITQVAPDTGVSSSDGFTSATTLTLTGTCAPLSTVEILAGASDPPTTVVGTATVVGGGWTFTWASGVSAPEFRYLRSQATLLGVTTIASTSQVLYIDPVADAPAIATVSAPAGATAGWTNQARPTFTGSADPGSSVTVLADGTPVATTTADAAGGWSAASVRDLTSGTHTITATQTDLAGNGESPASPGLIVHVDQVISEVVVYSATTGVTRDNTPGYSGKAEVGSTVELRSGSASGTILGFVTADAAGLWSLAPVGAQPDGAYTYVIVSRDAAGNSKTAGPFSVTIDTVVVGVLRITDFITEPGLTLDGGTTADRSVTVRGTITGTESGVAVAVSVNGRGIGDAVIAGSVWTATIPTTLNDGQYAITAQARDPAGNATAQAAAGFTVDGAPDAGEEFRPQLDAEIGGGLSLVTSDTTPTLTGLARPNSTLTVTQSPGSAAPATVTATAGGAFSFTPSPALADGTYTYVFSNADGSSATYTVTVDAHAPGAANAIAVTDDTGALSNDRITWDDRLVVSALGFIDPAPGAAPLTATLSLDGSVVASVTVDGGGRADFDLTGRVLPDGVYTARVTARDAAGNVGPAFSATFTVDRFTDPPLITGISPDTGNSASDGISQVGATSVITGRAEPGATVTLTFVKGGTTTTLSAVANAGGSFATAPGELLGLALADGSWTVTPLATDVAGNTNLASHHPDLAGSRPASGFTLGKDTTAPAVTAHISEDRGISSSDNLTSDDRLVVTGVTDALARVVVTFTRGAVSYTRSVQADASGDYIADFTGQPLASGAWTMTTQATDPAGNASAIDSQTVTIDVTVPTVTLAGAISVDSNGTLVGVTVGTTSDRITSDTNVLASGTMETGSTVELLVDGASIGAATLAGATWQSQSGVLAPGTHTLVARATDAAGNTATTGPLSVVIDTAMANPTVSRVAPSQGFVGGGAVASTWTTNATTVTITAAGESGSAVRLAYKLSSAGTWTDLPAQATSGGNATWSGLDLSALAPAGVTTSFDLRVDGVDHAGNASPGFGTATLLVDRVVPGTTPTILNVVDDTTPFTSPPWNGAPYTSDTYTRDNRLVVSGDGADAAAGYVRVYVNGVARGWVATPAGGAWSLNLGAAPFNVVVPDGNLTLTATNGDLAGNEGPESADYHLTVDTRKPTAVITGMTSADTGRSGSDRITQTAQPDFAGTVADPSPGLDDDDMPLVSFTLKRSGTVIPAGTATIPSTDSGGATDTWVYATPAAQPDGSYTLEVIGRDLAGNASSTAVIAFTIDRVATPPAGLKLTTATDTGASNTDLITNVVRPTVTGNVVERQAFLRIYRDTIAGQQIGSGTADAAGAWSVALSQDLVEGSNTLAVVQEDIAGNVSAAALLVVTLDTVAPDRPTLAGLTVATDSGTPGDALTNAANPALEGGCATDTDNLILTVTGTAGTSGTVTVNIDQSLGVAAWAQVLAALPEGTWSGSIVALDTAGNVSLASTPPYAFTVDRTPPQIAISGLTAATDSGVAGDNRTNATQPVLAGTIGTDAVSMALTVTGAGAFVPVPVAGAWSWQPGSALGDGAYPCSATATDAAGNVSAPATLTFTIDTIKPAKPSIDAISVDSGVDATDFITNDNTLIVSGTAEIGSSVALIYNGSIVGLATADGAGHFAVDLTALVLPDNTYTGVTCIAVDAAGNASDPSDPRTIVIDTGVNLGPPLITGLSVDSNIVGDWITSDNTPLISGQGKPQATVTLTLGGLQLGTALVDGGGNWSVQVASALVDQVGTLSATQIDLAGNPGPSAGVHAITIDTRITAPAITSITTDSGRSSSDGITNDTTLVLNGTAEPLAALSIRSNGTLLGTTTANASGAWSLAAPAAIEGVYSLVVTAGDLAGNSATSTPRSVTIDVTAPLPPTIVSWSDDTGTAGDGITSDRTPTLTGTTEAFGIVVIRDGATTLGSVTADVNGAWTYAMPSRVDGVHAVTVNATDIAGNTGAWSAATSITVDSVTTAPVISGLSPDSGRSPTDRITNATTLTVVGTGEPAATVTLRNGATVLGTALVDANGVWSVASTPVEGPLSLTATALDPAGNAGGPGTAVTGTIDRTAPAAPTLVLPSSPTNDTTPTLSGVAEADAQVQVLVGAVVIAVVAADPVSGAWTWTPATPLPDDTYAFRVRALDVAGNTGTPSAAQPLEIDTASPGVLILGITPDTGIPLDGVTSDPRPILVGLASPDTQVEITQGAEVSIVWSDADGLWILPLPAGTTGDLPDGTYPFTAVAYDAAGNASTPSSFTVVIDTAAPLAPVIDVVTPSTFAAATYTTDDATPVIGGGDTTAEAQATVTLSIDGTVVGTATANAQGAWSVQVVTALTKGYHTCQATATDLAGSESVASAPVRILVNLPPPPPVITGLTPDTGVAGDAITASARPSFQGTSEAGSTVTVTLRLGAAVTATFTAVADSNGLWTGQPPADLTDATYTAEPVAVDVYGNTRAGLPFPFVIDAVSDLPVAQVLVLAGEVSANVVRVSIDGHTVRPVNGRYRLEIPVPPEPTELTIELRDANGHTTTGRIAVGTIPGANQ